jgi:hypothetical protein
MGGTSYTDFQAIIGIVSSLLSIFGLVKLVFLRSHLPEARLLVLDGLLTELERYGHVADSTRFNVAR